MIKDQGDRQLGLINKLNVDKTKKIDCYNLENSESRKFANKVNKTIDEIKKIKNGKDEKTKFNYYRSDGKTVDYFENYTDLNEFGKDIKKRIDIIKQSKRGTKKIKKLQNHSVVSEDRTSYKNKVITHITK